MDSGFAYLEKKIYLCAQNQLQIKFYYENCSNCITHLYAIHHACGMQPTTTNVYSLGNGKK